MPDHNRNSKDPLEQLFQKKADEYDIRYREADWENLKKRLDQLDKKKPVNFWRYAAAAAVILLAGLLSFFIYQNNTKINRLEQQLRNQPMPIIQNHKSSKGQKPAPESHQNKITSVPGSGNKTPNTSEGPASGIKQHPQIPQNEDFAQTKHRERVKKISDNSFNNNVGIKHLLASGNLFQANNQPDKKLNSETISLGNKPMARPVQDGKTTSPYLAALGKSSTTIPAAAKIGAYNSISHFSLSLVIAPDFSTVGSLSNFDSPGYKLGAVFGYRWNRNFGFGAGIIYSQVNYSANGSEYHPSDGPWTYGIAPQKALANCAILVLPIHFKYDFIHLGSSRLYMTAGISSYIMLNEAYHFNYARKNESELVQSLNLQTGTGYWMSNVTLSLGYEVDLNSTISIGFEPYLNIPIRRVGWGNVKLYSVGSFITLNYHLW